jgi:dolichol-phosphate hexosyltransferase
MAPEPGAMDGTQSLSILMPVYNEAATVEQAMSQVLETVFPVDVELIVVDDGSADGTREVIAQRRWPGNVTVLHHDRNQGKGAAVRTALEHARGTVSAILDADLEYEPADTVALLEPVLAGRTNTVFGVRAFDGWTSYSFMYVMGNRFVTLVANVLFNVYLGDVMTCHKVVTTDVLRSLPLRAQGFDIEPEIAARLIQRGERIFEMPVSYVARERDEGKKLTAVDGLRAIRALLRFRLSPIPRLAGAGASASASRRLATATDHGQHAEGGDHHQQPEHDSRSDPQATAEGK